MKEIELKERYGIDDHEYYLCIDELINHDKVMEMDKYCQHGIKTTLDHCIKVSYNSYKFAKKYHLDYRSCARGGLLHDMFLYDWHNSIYGMRHSYMHPVWALENANKYFTLTKKEKDIIRKHMWPLVPYRIPLSREGFIVSYMDKSLCIREFFEGKNRKKTK